MAGMRPLIRLSTGQTATAAANTAVTITLTAVPNMKHRLSYVAWSYTAAPTGGRLTIANGSGNTVFDVDITASGPGALLPPDLVGSPNTAVIITLAAGSGA